ncbi:C-factor [Teleopsis dalmanni]|uniref:C-factor n=1 Tax=Teleopsis dalmanni TaxID=139649 RepID=UPI0018CDDFCF|nr:C-factor [Teleopsis dalmanni]XP_037937538.1 C-factor [Teleopsis dalmanni]
MNSILITGCNRGLGLGLVKELIKLNNAPKHIFATCRDLAKATELRELADNNSNLTLFEVDLRNFEYYNQVVNEINEATEGCGLNVLFNNAGIAPKSTRISLVKEEDLRNTLTTNTIVPILLTKACLPLLKKASKRCANIEMGINRAAIINMSSILGSIEDNNIGGLYAYRTSKAALNAATKSMSIDLFPHKILCVSLHPGWVRTELGGSNAPLDVDTSTSTIVKTLMELNSSHNGGFYQYDGKQLPW